MSALRWLRGSMTRLYRRHAMFEAFLFVAAMLSGLGGTLTASARSRSVVSLMPPAAQTTYYSVLLVGALVGLFGLLSARPVLALLCERAGLVMLAGLTACFGTAGLAYSGLAGIPGAVMLLGFSAASVARIWQIHGDLVAVRQQIAELARMRRYQP